VLDESAVEERILARAKQPRFTDFHHYFLEHPKKFACCFTRVANQKKIQSGVVELLL
jgi:hypothetical protein